MSDLSKAVISALGIGGPGVMRSKAGMKFAHQEAERFIDELADSGWHIVQAGGNWEWCAVHMQFERGATESQLDAAMVEALAGHD